MTESSPADRPSVVVRMAISGNIVERRCVDDVMGIIETRLRARTSVGLAVGSVNLDHLHHFRSQMAAPALGHLEWLLLADGMPIALRGRVLTASPWPRVSGADLLPRILELAARGGWRMGFLGGTSETHKLLADKFMSEYPDLPVAGFWSPERDELSDRSDEIAAEIASARPDILIVSLGKPRQERWIERYGPVTGAKIFLPFGAATDFIAGTSQRAPSWMRSAGLEWLYRLTREPRRLARRYLVQGPVSLLRAGRAQLLHYPGAYYSPTAEELRSSGLASATEREFDAFDSWPSTDPLLPEQQWPRTVHGRRP